LSESVRKWGMSRLLTLLIAWATGVLRSRHDLLMENLALRQQLMMLTQKYSRSRLAATDRLFWVLLRRLWSGWRRAVKGGVKPGHWGGAILGQ
jgi:putative transposase